MFFKIKRISIKKTILLILTLVIGPFFIRFGITQLFWVAADSNQIGLMRTLRHFGPYMEFKDQNRTLLMYAIEENNVPLVKELLRMGANPNQTYPNGATLLESTESPEIALLLKRYGGKSREEIMRDG